MIEILDIANDDDQAKDTLTPKGIATVCMLQSGLITSMDDQRFKGFWRMFCEDMERFGYLKNYEDDLK